MATKHIVALRYYGQNRIPAGSGWTGLQGELENLGVEIYVEGNNAPPSHLVVIDWTKQDEARWPEVPKRNRYLIASECATVNPGQFTERVGQKFSLVYVPSVFYPKLVNSEVWREGGYFNLDRFKARFSNDGRRGGCGLINENKFSLVSGSNYILRTNFIANAVKNGLPLTIAGRNWNRGLLWTSAKLLHHLLIAARGGRLNLKLTDALSALRFATHKRSNTRNYVGAVPDSIEFLSKFKVAVVIENESSYTSEKLYSAFAAGCQCVYVGPPLDAALFPKGFLFQSEPRAGDIVNAVELALNTYYKISEDDIGNWFESGRFFQSEDVRLRNTWLAKDIWARITSQLN